MLTSIEIRNFRLFEHLKIDGLGRVNLVAGMNNSGKTALLEALRIWAADGHDTVVNATLKERGEFRPGWVESYEALYRAGTSEKRIVINDLTIDRHIADAGKYWMYMVNEQDTKRPSDVVIISLSDAGLDPNVTTDNPKDGCVYIPFSNQHYPLENLWQSITLTDDEDAVLDVVRQAEPNILGIDIRSDSVRVRLKNHPVPVSMGRLGDGIMQTLKIAVGLVSARNTAKRLLLIDEIEAGLHHSVQLLVWEKVFRYAGEWDVQVFATTHSQDTVRTFAEVAGRPEYEGQGCYFRLERDAKEQIKAVVYDMQQLATSIEYALETR